MQILVVNRVVLLIAVRASSPTPPLSLRSSMYDFSSSTLHTGLCRSSALTPALHLPVVTSRLKPLEGQIRHEMSARIGDVEAAVKESISKTVNVKVT